MKVALCIRKEYKTQWGGDSVQITKTKEWLDKLFTITTEIIVHPELLDESFDLVHIFNIATKDETQSFFINAKALNKKIVLSTIFWDYKYQATKDFAKMLNFNVFTPPGIIDIFTKLDNITSILINKPRIISSNFRQFVTYCVQQSDVLLPNSFEELKHVADFTKLNFQSLKTKTIVVVNAADAVEENEALDIFSKYGLPQKYILQVGRIEYIKNQLGLVTALQNNKELPIVFLGRVNDEKYFKVLKKKSEERGNVFFINEVEHKDIHQFYKNALLHVLPSMRESPGLVNLEALLNECPIVVSNHKFLPFDTYFKGIATDVDPLSPASIKKGIYKELKIKRDMPAIKQLIKEKFSWQQAATQTYEGYMKALTI